MKKLILCEGTTDLLLLQFVLMFKYGWSYLDYEEEAATNRLVSKMLFKNGNIVEIKSCGGISKIPQQLAKEKDRMSQTTNLADCYENIIILIDHDTVESNASFMNQINEAINSEWHESDMAQWLPWKLENVVGEVSTEIFIKSIPEDEVGAIERVMLSALNSDEIEDMVIGKCREFVTDIANSQVKYIQKMSRREKTIFNTYFAIRTPEEKHDERSRILRAYDWGNNEVLDLVFNFLDIV